MLAMSAVSVVVLTMGDRPEELAAAIGSARAQTGVDVEIVLVVNGGDPNRTLADIVVEPGENLGIPAGRNAGAAVGSGPLICFLDDDGRLHREVLASAATAFVSDPRLGVIGLRIVDEAGETARRHVPGLRRRPDRSAGATSFPGGACIVRRAPFDGLAGLCGEFRYGLEETDLAWRVIDAGWNIVYRADLYMTHPRTVPTRHPDFHRRTARNRVWLAHRLLPLPLAVLYVANWTLVTAVRNIGNPSALAAHAAGTLDGLRNRLGPRAPMKWSSIIRLVRLGRPPVI